MKYREYSFSAADENTAEILFAFLSEKEFETFELKGNEVFAYVADKKEITQGINDFILDLAKQFSFTWQEKVYEDRNWNEEWEKNFQPVVVEGKCLIRAPFHHADPSLPYEIIIEPRMSFGTGHHDSTYLMVKEIMGLDLKNKSVADAGCGTGILSIMAVKCGAAEVFAFDNNEWAYSNTIDNIALNGVTEKITVAEGDINLLSGKSFDVILANINRNIIIENFPAFYSSLENNGLLVISGILATDFPVVAEEAVRLNFSILHHTPKGDWISAVLCRSST